MTLVALLDVSGLDVRFATPDARYKEREGAALASIAGLHHLAPNDRATLILREVLGLPAIPAARCCGQQSGRSNSALRRAPQSGRHDSIAPALILGAGRVVVTATEVAVVDRRETFCVARVCSDDRRWWLGDGWCGGVVLLGGVRSRDGAVGVVVDFEHREVGHESVGCGAVPVILSWLEEAAVAVADDLNRAAAALAAADPVEDLDRLAVAETRLLGSYPDAGVPVIPVRSPIDVLREQLQTRYPRPSWYWHLARRVGGLQQVLRRPPLASDLGQDPAAGLGEVPVLPGARRTRVSPRWGLGGRELVAGCRVPSALIRNNRSVPGGTVPSAEAVVTRAPAV